MQKKVGADEDGNSAYTSPPSTRNTPFSFDQPFHAGGQLGNYENINLRRSDILENPFQVTEMMVVREMEKRRIRENIIREGFLRWRELEAEVIREMIMEEEILMRRRGCEVGGGELLLADSGIPVLGRREEFGSDERLALLGRPGSRVLGGFQVQHQPESAVNEIAAKPIIKLSKEKLLSSVKPVNSSFTGIKRKIEAPKAECANGAPSVNLSKNLQPEWSCAVCQVTATCEQRLKNHLRGKEHQAKEKILLKTGKTVNNNADGTEAVANETENSNEPSVPTASLLQNLGWSDRNLNAMNNLEAVDHPLQQNTDLKVAVGGDEVSEKQHTTELNTEIKFWCTMCEVGTTSGALMTAHWSGKDHKDLLRKNGGGVMVIKTKPGDIRCNNADGSEAVADETENSNEPSVPTASLLQNRGRSDENLNALHNLEAVDHPLQQKADLKVASGGGYEVSEKHTTELNTEFKFWCTMCEVGTDTEALMTAHRSGKEHMDLLRKNGGGVIVIKTMPSDIQCINVTKDAAAEGKEKSFGNTDGEAERVGADGQANRGYAAGGELVTKYQHLN